MQIGITSVQRDRAPWIKEWIAFHHLVGFNKFYIFVHQSSDGTKEILDGLKSKFDITTVVVNEDTTTLQFDCNQYSCDHFLNKTDWMAFIDGDEFLFPTSKNTMEEALSEFSGKKISAIGVYWSCFGSSNFETEPDGLITQNYKKRAGDGYVNNRHIKSIIRGKNKVPIKVGKSAHLFDTPHGTYDENLRLIENGLTDYQPTYNKFRINHYLCQSRSYFQKTRGNTVWVNGGRLADSWWNEHNRNDVLDTSMYKFTRPLKNILNSI